MAGSVVVGSEFELSCSYEEKSMLCEALFPPSGKHEKKYVFSVYICTVFHFFTLLVRPREHRMLLVCWVPALYQQKNRGLSACSFPIRYLLNVSLFENIGYILYCRLVLPFYLYRTLACWGFQLGSGGISIGIGMYTYACIHQPV